MSDFTMAIGVNIVIVIALLYLNAQTTKLNREVGSIERYMIEQHRKDTQSDMENKKKNDDSYTDEYGDSSTEIQIQGNPQMAPPRVPVADLNNNSTTTPAQVDNDDDDDDDDYLDGPVLGLK
jgi:hypothetical protein